ncbi:hypothetical protein [Oceanobacillus polygoni]|uniref:Uncharacterized protein n=1 Tax=Oceanobacillus polygoni TaxID=1235259 RepID=A0A9X0YQM5_9BACI|nr:hypothetical protein [Oceanobacillus polygoni]MBP2077258.1 hypothetical protein [Oceanobacillus polygoni]
MVNKISLMDAYIIETLRKSGVSNQEIMQHIERKNVEVFRTIHASFDFNELIQLEERLGKAEFQKVLSEGYSIKFVTFNGLKNLLRLKFDIIEDRDYELKENGFSQLRISEDQGEQLEKMLSANWMIELVGKENNCVCMNIYLTNNLIGNL